MHTLGFPQSNWLASGLTGPDSTGGGRGLRGCGVHHLQVFGLWNTPHTRYGLRHVQELFIQERLWSTPLTSIWFVEYTMYKIWLTPCSSYLYNRGCGIHHIQGFGLWNTPHTRYGLRHVQELFIQEVVEYTTYKVLICGIHHILDMAYAMFKDYLYKRLWSTPRSSIWFVEYTTY